jgi:hypothetical protein
MRKKKFYLLYPIENLRLDLLKIKIFLKKLIDLRL